MTGASFGTIARAAYEYSTNTQGAPEDQPARNASLAAYIHRRWFVTCLALRAPTIGEGAYDALRLFLTPNTRGDLFHAVDAHRMPTESRQTTRAARRDERCKEGGAGVPNDGARAQMHEIASSRPVSVTLTI